MNRELYKHLGDYIREVDVRNRNLSVTTLLGVSISKEFIPSIANTIGTDMSTYKIVRKGQFAYGPVTSRNGDKVSIALLANEDTAIISQAYTIFEVKDTNELLPEYLMMWFRRPEFDRYARFHSHGSAREIFDWSEMCDVMLPIPSIERQREIVAEYETLSKRIRLNEQMISTLEATAQTLYRKMFVDGIDKENLPEGWRIGTLGEICDSNVGGDWGKDIKVGNYNSEVFCIKGADIPKIRNGMKSSLPTRFILSKNLENKKLKDGDIVIEISGGSPTQSTGRTTIITNYLLSFLSKEIICSNFCRVISVKKCYNAFVYATLQYLYNKGLFFKLENSSNGVKNLDLDSLLNEEDFLIPSNLVTTDFSNKYIPLINKISLKGHTIEKLTELQSLLLAKMGK